MRITQPNAPTRWQIRATGASAPPQGQNWSYTTPSTAVWLVLWLNISLTTTAVGGSRYVSLQLNNDIGGPLVNAVQPIAIPSSTTTNLHWYVGATAFAVGTAYAVAPIPSILLPPTSSLAVNVTGIQALDQLSAVRFSVVEITVAQGPLTPSERDDLMLILATKGLPI